MKAVFVKIALITSLVVPSFAYAIIAPSPVCTQEYAPVCGQKYAQSGITRVTYGNMCQLNADGAQFMSHGTCEQIPYYPYYPYNPQPYNPYYYGSAPTIQSFTGPTTLRTNESGTWYINVGSSTGNLTYSISWGDEMNYAYANSYNQSSYTSQQTTYTHTYSNPGTYTVRITARDTIGRTTQATATVTVYNSNNTYYPTYPYNQYQYPNYNYNYWWNTNNNTYTNTYDDVNNWNYWWETSYTPQTYYNNYNQYTYPQYNYDNYSDYYGYGSSYGGQYNNYYTNYNNYDDSGWYPNYSYTWY